MTKIYLDIAFIKSEMERKGLNAKSLAERMNLSPQTIRKFLNGADQSHMSSGYLILFADALEVSILQLLLKEPKV